MTNVTVYGQAGQIQPDGMVRFGSDERMNVTFYMKSVPDRAKSLDQSRPVYKSVEYVRIQEPGEHLNIVDRPIADDPRVIQRWPNQYQRFISNVYQEIPDGTPLEVLFPTQPEIPANLHTYAIHTVEQLAGLTAHALQTVGMGAVEWQTKAQKFLNSAKGGIEYQKLLKEQETMRNQNEVLQNQVALLKQQVDRLSASRSGIPPAMVPTSAPNMSQQYFAQQLMQDQQAPIVDLTEPSPPEEAETLFEYEAATYGGPFADPGIPPVKKIATNNRKKG